MTATTLHPSSITTTDDENTGVTEATLHKLRRFNLVVGVLHLISATVMLLLANDFELQVSTLTLNGPPGTPLAEADVSEVWSFPLAIATAAFLYLSALFHFIVASGPGFRVYKSEISAGRNRFRWVEYSLSATLMILLISVVSGMTDVAALIAIAGVNVSMILFGWIMEMVNPPKRVVWWSPFWFGCIAGITPWLALVVSVAYSASRSTTGGPPGFVYGIIATIFVAFNCFAVNQWLQYRRNGRWADYVFGERTYIVLSLVAKSLLAWQIFANTLMD
ncbi:MAG: heliorhodopsin HeR [Acidimicrobiales bacterium]